MKALKAFLELASTSLPCHQPHWEWGVLPKCHTWGTTSGTSSRIQDPGWGHGAFGGPVGTDSHSASSALPEDLQMDVKGI